MCRLRVHDLVGRCLSLKRKKKNLIFACYILEVVALFCAGVPKKIKMLFLYIQLSTPCPTKKRKKKKKSLHHSVPEPCTHQFSINFHLERLDAHHSYAPLLPKNLMVFINKPFTHATPKIRDFHNQTVYTISTF